MINPIRMSTFIHRTPMMAWLEMYQACNEFMIQWNASLGVVFIVYGFLLFNHKNYQYKKLMLSVLFRMKEANIPCPDVVALKKHVLVMSFIGKDMLPAPKIKDVDLPFVDLTIMYDQTAEVINLQ